MVHVVGQMIEIDKEELELRVSQLATRMVNDEVEQRLKPIRKVVKIHAFFVSIVFTTSLILWFFYDDKDVFDRVMPLTSVFIIWIFPIWMQLGFRPRWMEAHWIDLDDEEIQ